MAGQLLPKANTKLILLALAMCGLSVCAAESALDLTTVPFEKLVETDVITASKLAKQISDAPSAVSIVTAADIRTFGYRTLADVINSMRGLYTTYDRRYQYLGGRGFGSPGDYTGRIMLLVDGNALQDNIYNQAYIDHSGLVDLELVDRVEYVPGTGSVTYGNNALLGIINIVTKKGRDFNSAELSADVFSFGGQKQRVTFGKQFDNGVNLLVSASTLHSAGQTLYIPYFDAIGLNGGIATNRDYERSQRFFAKLDLKDLSIEAAKSARTKASPFPRKENAFNLIYDLIDESTSVSARYDFDLTDNIKASSHLYYGRYDDKAIRQYGFVDPLEQYRKNNNQGQWWGLDQKFVLTTFQQQTVVLGAEYRNDFKQVFSPVALTDQFTESGVYYYAPFNNKTYSAYLTDEIILNDKLTANLGVRYDKPRAMDCSVTPCMAYAKKAAISPRVAVSYMPDAETTLKASYSEAFRLPNPNEVGSPDTDALLRSEHVAAGELVLQYAWSPTLNVTGSIYQYRLMDQHYYRSATGEEFFDGKSKTSGFEAQLDKSWDNDIQLRSSIALQNAIDTEGKRFVNSPKVMAKLNLSIPVFNNRWRAGVEAQYLGARITKDVRDSDYVVIRPGRLLPGTGLINVTLTSAQKWNGIATSFSIKNLLNKQYQVPSSAVRVSDAGDILDANQMDGRSFWLQLTYDFWR